MSAPAFNSKFNIPRLPNAAAHINAVPSVKHVTSRSAFLSIRSAAIALSSLETASYKGVRWSMVIALILAPASNNNGIKVLCPFDAAR